MNVITKLRNNWKKTVLAITVSGFGINYLNGKWKDWLLMKRYCLEAKKYGSMIIKQNNRPKRVTVIMNPAASKGNGKSLYEKYASTLLHLAGIEVNMIRTEFEGQAKDIMNKIDSTDAILVAGGDGTLSEVVTGILRRNDENKFSTIPIGIIPLGKTNTLAKQLCPTASNTIQFIAEMAMSAIDGKTKPVDVISIKGNEENSVYALTKLELGALTDSEIRKTRNWYFGPLKHKLCYVITTLKFWPTNMPLSFSYSHPCQGCNRCQPKPASLSWKWWHLFIQPKREITKDYSNIVNEECGKEIKNDSSFSQIYIKANENLSESEEKEETKSLKVTIFGNEISKTDFIKFGWNAANDVKWNSTNLKVQTIKCDFPDLNMQKQFLIDNDKFELMNLNCRLLPNRLKFYFCEKFRF